MYDVDPELGPKVPLVFRMHNEVLKIFGKHSIKGDDDLLEKLRELELPEEYLHYEQRRVPLVLDCVGCDEAELLDISPIRFTKVAPFTGIQTGTVGRHEALSVSLRLFSDGSPFVADGDDLDDYSDYHIFIGSEMPPTMVQEVNIGIAPNRSWDAINKHILSEGDCERLIDFLTQQKPKSFKEQLRMRGMLED